MSWEQREHSVRPQRNRYTFVHPISQSQSFILKSIGADPDQELRATENCDFFREVAQVGRLKDLAQSV
jgi:hypothetical protein